LVKTYRFLKSLISISLTNPSSSLFLIKALPCVPAGKEAAILAAIAAAWAAAVAFGVGPEGAGLPPGAGASHLDIVDSMYVWVSVGERGVGEREIEVEDEDGIKYLDRLSIHYR
jgi:hypothetical protein